MIDIAKRCPESGELVLYLDCQECEDKVCEKDTYPQNPQEDVDKKIKVDKILLG